MAYTAESLENAVSVFYSSEHSDRAEAHKWLTTAQRCPEAWSFVWELLQSQKGTEVQFFAATTLHTKLQRSWIEIPPSKYEELKSRILDAIFMFSHGPQIVLNRLCISLAAFLLHQDGCGILESVEPLLSSDNATIILEILSVIPEEFNNMTMTGSHRSSVRHNLQQMTHKVIELVTKQLCFDSQRSMLRSEEWSRNVSVWQSACQCASSWLEMGGMIPGQCASILTAALQVLHAIYWSSSSCQTEKKELSSLEFEACESALKVASAALTQPDAGKQSMSCQPLFRLLLDAVEPILAIEDVLHTSNDELVGAIYGVIITVGECHASWIASALALENGDVVVGYSGCGDADARKMLLVKKECTRTAKDFMKLVLRCSDAPGNYPTQETHSQLAFGFWYIIQDEALRDVPETLGTGCCVQVSLRVWYEQLANILLRKSTYLLSPGSYSAEDAEMMRCYRQDVADIMLYCYSVLGPELLQQLGLLLEQLSATVSEQSESEGEGLATAQLEAVLHAFNALGESAGAGERGSPILLFRTLLNLPYHTTHHQLLITALDCFCSYAEWLGSEDAGDAINELVGRALQVVCSALSVPSAGFRASLALHSITRECSSLLAPHAITLLTTIQAGQSSWGFAVGIKVMGAAGSAAASLPAATAGPYVAALISPLLTTLQNTQRPQLTNSQADECKLALRHAIAFVGALCLPGTGHAHVPLTMILPVLPHSARHPLLIDPVLGLVKIIMVNLMDECIPLLPDLKNILNITLEIEPHSSSMEIAKVMTLMFPELCESTMSVAADAMMRECKSELEKGHSLSELSPLLQSFFSAVNSTFVKKPQVLDHLQYQLQHIVQLAIMTISLPEQGPVKTSCAFLGHLAQLRPAELLAQAPTLVQRLVHCIGVLTPRSHLDPFSDVLFGLGKGQWDASGQIAPGPAQLGIWLKEALQPPGFPSERATPQVKEKFIKTVIRHHAHKRRLIEDVSEFALSCRGLLGEYGQEVTQAARY